MPDLRFSVSDGREFLARHDLLGHLTPEELDRLLAPARIERLDEGRVLFRKGDPGDSLYVVLAGRCISLRGAHWTLCAACAACLSIDRTRVDA